MRTLEPESMSSYGSPFHFLNDITRDLLLEYGLRARKVEEVDFAARRHVQRATQQRSPAYCTRTQFWVRKKGPTWPRTCIERPSSPTLMRSV